MNEPINGVPEAGDRKFKVVYTIIDKKDKGRKNVWIRIGTAFINKDQSLNVMLDALPANNSLHIRDYEPFVDGKTDQTPQRNDSFPPRFETSRGRPDPYHPNAPSEGALR